MALHTRVSVTDVVVALDEKGEHRPVRTRSLKTTYRIVVTDVLSIPYCKDRVLAEHYTESESFFTVHYFTYFKVVYGFFPSSQKFDEL